MLGQGFCDDFRVPFEPVDIDLVQVIENGLLAGILVISDGRYGESGLLDAEVAAVLPGREGFLLVDALDDGLETDVGGVSDRLGEEVVEVVDVDALSELARDVHVEDVAGRRHVQGEDVKRVARVLEKMRLNRCLNWVKLGYV